MSKPLLVIKCGEKLESLNEVNGDYEDWILNGMQWHKQSITCSVYLDEPLPGVNDVSAVVITGSGSMVTDEEAWIPSTINWLQQAFKTSLPVLGICFGHQLLAKALGGQVSENPNGVEVGTVTMTVVKSDDPLFKSFPRSLSVQVSHQQAVLKLPANTVRLATTDMDENHAFRYGDSVWGIQFHPEFDEAIIEKYIAFYQEENGEGLKYNPASETVESTLILRQFANLINQ